MLLQYIKNIDYKEKKIFFIASSFTYQYKISKYVSRMSCWVKNEGV